MLAFVFHWPPEVLLALTMREVEAWLHQVVKLHPKKPGAGYGGR